MAGSRYVQLLLAFALTVGLGVIIWRQVDQEQLRTLLRGADLRLVAALLLLHFLYQVIRASRLWVIFPELRRRPISLLSTVCIQGALTAIVPLWLGEIAMIAMLRRWHDVQLAQGAAAVIFVRLLDLILQGALFAIALVVFRDRLAALASGPSLLLLLVPIAALVMLAWLPRVRRTAGDRLGPWLRAQLGEAAAGLRWMSTRQVLVPVLLLTVVMWGAMFEVFRIILNITGIADGYLPVFYVYSMLFPVSILPLKGFGDFGSHEGAWYVLLRLWGLDSGGAAAVAFGSHILILMSVLFLLVVGGIGRWLTRSGRLEAGPK